MVNKALRNSPFGEFRKLTRLFEEPLDASVLILGSSRAELNFNPEWLATGTGNKVYNGGLTGANLVVSKAILAQRLALNHPIQTLILNVDHFLWSNATVDHLTDGYRYLPYLRHSPVYTHLAAGYPELHVARWFAPYAVTWMGDRQLYQAWRGHRNRPVKVDEEWSISTGFRVIPHLLGDNMFETKVMPVPGWVSMSEVQALHDIYTLCQENGIRVYTVLSPVYRGKLEPLNLDSAWKIMMETAVHFQSPVMDYSHWEHNGNKDLFYDDIHLNPDGARLFNAQFSSDFRSLTGTE